ncbi:MAG: hypothetical protein K2H45_06785 [Acetatifactor sp.]|nr:hypothetical protein [Acetatifactor sp.]
MRSKTDQRDEKLGYKIREARMDRVPCMLIVGEKEQLMKLFACALCLSNRTTNTISRPVCIILQSPTESAQNNGSAFPRLQSHPNQRQWPPP